MKEKINKKTPTDSNAPEAPIEEDSRLKLFQKFQELKDAFETNNKNYFQLEEIAAPAEAI
jgi:hypothetical protein